MSRRAMILVFAATLAAALQGCAILSPGSGMSGGSATLSDAVNAATADSGKKVKTLDAGESTPPADRFGNDVETHALGVSASAVPAVQTGAPKAGKSKLVFGAMFGGGTLGGSDYDGFKTVGLSLGSYEPHRMRVDLLGSATDLDFRGESKLGAALQGALDLDLAFTARYYMTPDHTFTGVYGMAGVSTGTLFWDYPQPIPVVQDGEPKSITSDRINHFDFFLGAGTTLMRFRHLELGGNAVGGIRLYGWHTQNGFDNDEFPTTGLARASMELAFK